MLHSERVSHSRTWNHVARSVLQLDRKALTNVMNETPTRIAIIFPCVTLASLAALLLGLLFTPCVSNETVNAVSQPLQVFGTVAFGIVTNVCLAGTVASFEIWLSRDGRGQSKNVRSLLLTGWTLPSAAVFVIVVICIYSLVQTDLSH